MSEYFPKQKYLGGGKKFETLRIRFNKWIY